MILNSASKHIEDINNNVLSKRKDKINILFTDIVVYEIICKNYNKYYIG